MPLNQSCTATDAAGICLQGAGVPGRGTVLILRIFNGKAPGIASQTQSQPDCDFTATKEQTTIRYILDPNWRR
jgi:hypothetical protein